MIRKIYKTDYRGYEIHPKRRATDEIPSLKYSRQSDRNSLRKCLMEDFYSKCAYCGWENVAYADSVFHIEHTKSKDKYEELVDDYQFMALACPVCNCSKNNKESDYYIDPIDPEFKTLFYRNKFGAIVINNELDEEKKILSKQYMQMIGLYKELYKIDYIYGALKKITACEVNMDEKDYLLIGKITEIIEFINKLTRRRTNYTDF